MRTEEDEILSRWLNAIAKVIFKIIAIIIAAKIIALVLFFVILAMNPNKPIPNQTQTRLLMTYDKYKKEFEDWWSELMKDMPDAKTSFDSRLDNLIYRAL